MKDEISIRLARLEEKFINIDNKFSNMDKKIDKIPESLEKLSFAIEQVRSDVHESRTDHKLVQLKIEEHEKEIKEIKSSQKNNEHILNRVNNQQKVLAGVLFVFIAALIKLIFKL